MPGLSQLKQFNKDLLSLGDEITIRASRGEKPVQVIIPKEVEDVNDSEDFVLGMPEIEAEIEVAPVDEDLSDLAGLASPSSDSGSTDSAPSFEAPDLSSLLNPINVPDDASAGADMPDLSMFEEPAEQEEEIVEEEPEEISIADMGLDALLSGGGFDAPEEETPEPESEPVNLNIDDFQEVEDLDSLDADNLSSETESAPVDDGLTDIERDLLAMTGEIPAASAPQKKEEPSLDDLLGNLDFDQPAVETSSPDNADLDAIFGDTSLEEPETLDDFEEMPEADVSELSDIPELSDVPEELTEIEDIPEVPEVEDISDIPEATEDLSSESFDLDSLGDIPGINDFETSDNIDNALESGASDDLESLGADLGDLVDFANTETEEALPEESFDDVPDLGDFSLDSIGSDNTELENLETEATDSDIEDSGTESLGEDDFGLDDFDTNSSDVGMEDFASSENEDLDSIPEPAEELNTENFGLDDLGSLDDFSDDVPEEVSDSDETGLDSFSGDLSTDLPDDFSTDGLDSLDDIPDAGIADDASDSVSTESFGLDDFGTDNFDATNDNTSTTDGSADFGDLNLDDMDFGTNQDAVSVDFDENDEIPDYGDESDSSESEDSFSFDGENETPEVFDTTEMDGMDFGIPDTDTQLDGGSSDFEFGGEDEFAMEGEFEIPGFSDVQTAKEEKSKTTLVGGKDKKGRNRDLPEPDFSDAEESENLPPNTLSDSQYRDFLKNLGEYPLNVRLAFEDLIVQDEFTDDAEFEVIEKILNKAPARQVASMLEKMLDISIPVPRDFEHRTAEEYEAYKKSLSYQLKNKIIPGILVGLVALLVMWGIFNFTKNCIYKPLKANKLYKQGYALLEADEYPQSEMKFEEAVTYRINKKWFFNFARGYREHRQYQRAGSMYDRILKYYKHDKAAGLEYADMELNDLANYERAEEIVRREVLDYHINDADGILMLGDIFLEWGTEKDPAKLENAREQYATLLQLYKSTDLYLSRMMRYFVRTDNLRQVIQVKNTFEPKEKSLSAEDWTELSGYLLEKYYGPLAPSDEYLRYEIEGLRGLLLRAVKANPDNPIALYNLAKYFIQSGETAGIEQTLQNAIEKFNTVQSMKKRDIYKYIDSYRLLGEHYIDTTDFLQAQEQFAEGISLYTTERDNAGFEGTPDIGKLYADMGNIKYTISGDYDDALMNYKYSVELENDTPSIRYRIGYIQYKNKNYVEALGSFMKAGDGNVKQRNLLLAMANTLSLRGDDYAAQGYYNQLIDSLDLEIAKRGVVFPQANIKDYDVVNTYLSAANNYGVTLYKLAKRTGNSGLNAQAIVQFQQSLRAWDSLTRNQETLVRLSGSNLAEQNIQYITHPIPEFEPAIYTDIAKTLLDNEHL